MRPGRLDKEPHGTRMRHRLLTFLGAGGWETADDALLPSRGRAMPQVPSRRASPNRILSRLSADDFGALEPHLQAVPLPLRRQLEMRNKKISHVYFIENGFASVVANGHADHSIEVGIVGREGVTGLAVIMGADRSPHETYMQVAGSGQCITAAKLRQAMDQPSCAAAART